ncbi:MAG: hypothetical protein LBP26_02520, partial [Clostridiales bacterium]|nr:hypothetical protein [Clostridiales bacterium]
NYDNRTVIKNIYGEEKLDADGYIEKAETFLRLNDYDNAEKQFKLAIEAEPSNWKGWFGIVECCTKNFTNLNDKRHKTYLERARKVADKESLSKMNSIYNSYANIVHKAVHKAKLKRESCIKFIVAVAVIFATFAFMLISIVIWAS